MLDYDPSKIAGEKLRKLIKEQYGTQEEFADNYGLDVRTVRRYINKLKDTDIIMELALHFDIHFLDFYSKD